MSAIEQLFDFGFFYESGKDLYVKFGFKDTEGIIIDDCDGTADITITDDNGLTVYQDTIEFSEDDFYTLDGNNEKCLCCIEIQNMKRPTAPIGSISLSVEVMDYDFEDDDLEKQFNPKPITIVFDRWVPRIILPDTPLTIYNNSYDGETEIEIKEIHFTFSAYDDFNLYINGKSNFNLQFSMDIEVVSKTSNINYDENAKIYYKLYDSKKRLVDSSNIYSKSLSVGDVTTEESFPIRNLDYHEVYTLKIGGSKEDYSLHIK